MSLVELEQVLVIPTRRFVECGYFQGFSREPDSYIDRLLGSSELEYRPRGEMENDPSWKQLIPYCIFRHTGKDGEVRLFRYTRGRGGGEARLSQKMSIGVGGHISITDAENTGGDPSLGREAYLEGMRRELAEEVRIETACTCHCAGLINDDETPVGQVHLGIVYLFDVEEPLVFPAEEGIADSGFAPVPELFRQFDRLESWSQISLRALFEP